MPAKFLLLMGQILLLALVLYLRENHIFFDDSFKDMTTSEYNTAETTLVGVTVCYIIFMAIEILMQMIGVSLMYNQINLLQIFLHSLGCIFTTWFILEHWASRQMWPLWVCFGLFPFLLECCTIWGAVVFSLNVEKNRRGLFR